MAETHIPYEERLKRAPDFIVEYRIDLAKSLKHVKPGQGMRVDFLYEGDAPKTDGVHMIWPEILDANGRVVRDTTPGRMDSAGFSNMWIIMEECREYHHRRIKMGTKGMWWRGARMAYVSIVQVNEF